MKKCNKCFEEKPLSDFGKHKMSPDGLRYKCKICRNKIKIEYNKKIKNLSKKIPDEKFCPNCDETKNNALFYKNNSNINGLSNHCKSCTDKKYAEYKKENPEKIKFFNKRWSIKNLDKLRANQQNRRSREFNAEGTVTTKIVKQLYKEQDGLCAYCGIRVFDDYHIDHMVSLILGGSNLKENLCVSCPDCNLSKGGKSMKEWCEYASWLYPPTQKGELTYE